MPFDGISAAAPVRIVLHGKLKKFGRVREIGVVTAAEAIRVLLLLQPGFREVFQEGHYRIVRGPVRGGFDLEPATLHMRLAPGSELHIVPAAQGAGGRGGGKAVLGAVVMIAAIGLSPFTGGASLAAAMAAPALGGLTTYGAIFMFGASMFLGGISQMLSPQPKTPTRINANDDRSFLLGGVPNGNEQGVPVPLVYGRVRVGSVVASVGYSAEEYNPTPVAVPGATGSELPSSTDTMGYYDQNAIDQLRAGEGGAGGDDGGGGGHVQREAPNNLRSRAVVRIIDVISEGPIEGLATGTGEEGAKSIYFNNTPLMSADGKWNFRGVTWEVRTGQPDQSHVSGFSAAEQTVAVGIQVKFGAPVTRTVTSATATALRVTVRLPALYLGTSQGDLLEGPTLEYKFEVRPVGGAWTAVVQETITGGKCTSPYERSYRFNLPTSGSNSWEVRMTRITADAATVQEASDTWWAAYDIITDHKLIYPNTAYVALTFDAEAFGAQIPGRSYDIKGIQCRVPMNYDPVARTYANSGPGTSAGSWDGVTWKLAWTDNNAWVFYDLLSNSRYGAGLSAATLSATKWDLYQIAQYCDAQVPNGFGGNEPRYTMNVQVMDQEDAYRLLQKFVGSFRGMMFWAAGSLSVAADMPSTPVKLLNQANVIDGIFNYESSSLAARHNAARVAWRDPGDNYIGAVEMVEDYTATYLPGQRVADVVAFGVTSRGLANRLGRWLIDTENRAPETVSFAVSIDNMDIRPGDVVAIADRYYAGIRMGGRLVAGSTTTVLNLDASFAPNGGETYTISVLLPDGVLAQGVAISAWGSASGLTTVTVPALAQAPAAGAPFIITSTALAPRQFRVVGIAESERAKFTVLALQHDPNKYARIETGLVLESDTFSTLQSQLIGALPMLGERAYTVATSGGSATLTGVDTIGLEVGMRVAAGEPYPDGTVIQSINAVAGSVVLSANRTGVGAYSGPLKFNVITARSYLTGVGTTTVARCTVSWHQPTDIRVDRVEVRVHTADRIVGFYFSAGASIDIDNLPPDTYTFSVRPVGRDGRSGVWVMGHPHVLTATSSAPPAVTGLAAIGGVHKIAVTWNAVPTRDLRHYEIWRKVGGTLPGADPTLVAGAAFLRFNDATSNTDDDTSVLLPGTQGWYWVRPVSTTGALGPWAGPVGATTILLAASDLGGGIIGPSHFGTNLRPIEIIADLTVARPNDTYATSSTDNLLYRRSGGAWVRAVNAGDMSGQISGSQIAALQIAAGHVADNAIITRTILDGAVATAKIAAAAVTLSRIGTGADINYVWNPCGGVSTDGWVSVGSGGGGGVISSAALQAPATWSLNGHGSIIFAPVTDINAGTFTELAWRPNGSGNIGIPVTPGAAGERYGMQAMVIAKGGVQARFVCYWYDASNTLLASGALATYSSGPINSAAADGNSLDKYTLMTGFTSGTGVPANATRLDIRIRLANETAGVLTKAGDNPFLVVTRVAVWPLPSINATEIPPWTPGAATELPGGMLRASTVGTTQIAAGAITTAKLAVGTAANVVWNPTPGLSMDGYGVPGVSGTVTGLTYGPVLGSSYDPTWALLGQAGLFVAAASMANNAYIECPWRPTGVAGDGSMPVVPGDFVEAQAAFIVSNGCQPVLYIRWRDAAGASLGTGAFTIGAANAVADGRTLDRYTQMSIRAQAPALCCSAELVFRLNNGTGSTQTNPFLIATRFLIGYAKPSQTEATPWMPGGSTTISGGIIKTNTIQGNRIVSRSIEADRIAAGAITANEIAAGTILAGNLAAGSITASKLAISGGSIFPDMNIQDASFWTPLSPFLQNVNTGLAGPAFDMGVPAALALSNPSYTGTGALAVSSIAFATAEPGRKYYLRARGRNTNTTRSIWVSLSAVDTANAVVGSPVALSWLNTAAVDKDVQFTAPAGAVRLVIGISVDAGAAWTGTASIANITVVPAATGKMIVDGAIATEHMTAGTINADRLIANSITSAQLATTNLITTSAQIGTGVIQSANIGNLQVKSAQIDNLTVGTGKIAYNAATRVSQVGSMTDVAYPGGRSPSGGQASCYMNTTVQVEDGGTVVIFLRASLKETATNYSFPPSSGGAGEGGGVGEGNT